MYVTWLRQLELLGMDDGGAAFAAGSSRGGPFAGRVEEAGASSQRIWAHAEATMMERAREGCRRHDLKAYDRVFAIMHQKALLGMEGARDAQPGSAIETMMDQCYRWEVELVSDVTSDLPGFHNRFQVGATAPYDATPGEHKATLAYRALEISGRPMEAIGRVLGAAAGSAPAPSAKPKSSGDMSDAFAAFVEYGMNYALSPSGSRAGSLQVLGVAWTDVVRDTVGTSCAGRDEKQQATVADSMQVLLRLVPPTEIVKYTPVRASPLAHTHDEDMHEWMRFFTQFRQAADEGSVPEPREEEEGARDSGAAPITLTVRVKEQEPGVWRAEFRTPKGVTGEGLSETGHLVLRHVPR
jgi:hypothetical protein